jgi:ADP-ribose pyrophosphatase YjhB (NUDIX family)
MAVIQRRRDGALLVAEAVTPSGGLFHRPLGGHAEYGEYALETVHHEFREEIGRRFGRANPSPSVNTYRDRR